MYMYTYIHICVYTYTHTHTHHHNFCIHLSVDGHLGCFHVLATVKSAAINTGVHASLSIRFSQLGWLSGRKSACNAGDTGDAGLIPRLGRSPGGGHANPLQYSCQENPTDGGWQATVHGVTKSQT